MTPDGATTNPVQPGEMRRAFFWEAPLRKSYQCPATYRLAPGPYPPGRRHPTPRRERSNALHRRHQKTTPIRHPERSDGSMDEVLPPPGGLPYSRLTANQPRITSHSASQRKTTHRHAPAEMTRELRNA